MQKRQHALRLGRWAGQVGLWRRQCLVLALGCGASLLAQPGAAQTAPPADARPGGLLPTPAQLAPREATVTDGRDLPARPLPRELEKPSDELTLDVRGYQLSPNAPPALVAQLATLLAPYIGERRSYEDLVNAAADVTRYLQRDAGYYLGYAYLPEQQPRDGIVRIEVLEGRLDRIELLWPADLPVRREVIEAHLARLEPGAILRVRDIERVVFLINDLRGITARFDVVQGSLPGTASLRVTGQAESRWSARADADVNGSRYLGLGRIGALAAGNSLLGRGDSLALNALASTTGGLYFGLLGYTLPVGSDGVKLGSSLSVVRYQLDEAEFPLGINGDALTLSTYALYPWVRSRNFNLFVVGTFDHKRNTDRQDVAGSRQRRSLSSGILGLTGDLRDNLAGGAVSTFEASLASGSVHYVGGAPAGLDDAPRYTKLTLGANRLQNLIDGRLLFYAALRGQWALDNLDTSEQFRIGGPDGVRAFAPGEGTGDTGLVLNAELRLLPSDAWLGPGWGRLARETVLSLFVDHGEIRFRHDASRQPARFVNRAHFTGAGLSLAWERPGEFALRISLSSALAGVAKSDPRQREPRLYAQFSKFY
jgi:hemolysin activation/secretion protein